MTDNRCNAANLFLPVETEIGVDSLITFTRTRIDEDGKVKNVNPGILGPNFKKVTKPLIEIRHGGILTVHLVCGSQMVVDLLTLHSKINKVVKMQLRLKYV